MENKNLYEEMMERLSCQPEKPFASTKTQTKERIDEEESRVNFITAHSLDKKYEPKIENQVKMEETEPAPISVDSFIDTVNVDIKLEEKPPAPTPIAPSEAEHLFGIKPIKSSSKTPLPVPTGPTPSREEMIDYLDKRILGGDQNKFVINMWRKRNNYTPNMIKRIESMMKDEPIDLITEKLKLYAKLDTYYDQTLEMQNTTTNDKTWNDCEKLISIINYYRKSRGLTNRQYNFVLILVRRLGL